MDDVTSGFNIGTNISLDPQFADFTGFRHDDLRAISDYYAATACWRKRCRPSPKAWPCPHPRPTVWWD